jgi:glycosyltransferase involved in cell wall biosynthesis
MKKVLVIGPLPPPTGGMGTVFEQIISMKLKRYKIIPFNTTKSNIIKSFIIFNIINFFYRCLKLIIILITKHIDILHIHTASKSSFWQNAVYLKISKILKKKVILHMHGASFKEFYMHSKNKKGISKILNETDIIVALSETWKQYYSTISNNKNIYVVNNSIEHITMHKYKRIFPKDEFIVLFIGSICQRKGAYDLIESIKDTTEPKIKFAFIGPYENKKIFLEKIKKYNIEKKCYLIGEIVGKERFKYFASGDVFVLPSYAEGLPLTILEAMAFGKPIISTNVGAIPEVVKKDNGILIEPGDIPGIKKAIKYIYNNNNKYGKNNKLKIKRYYSPIVFRKKIGYIYDAV